MPTYSLTIPKNKKSRPKSIKTSDVIVPKPSKGTPQTKARTMNPIIIANERPADATPMNGITLRGINEDASMARRAK